MNNRKYTGGFRADRADLEYLKIIQKIIKVSRAEAIRLAIKNLYELEKQGDDIKKLEIHFFYGDELRDRIMYLENKLNLDKSTIYKLAIRKF